MEQTVRFCEHGPSKVYVPPGWKQMVIIRTAETKARKIYDHYKPCITIYFSPDG